MDKTEKLNELLSFSHCEKMKQILDHALVVARELIQNWKIVSPKGERRFFGLEFYINIPGVFEDDATHKRKEQLKRGTFYFHTKSKDGWTPPIFNRHGVDITCGDGNIHGGILLRHLGGISHKDGSGLALRSLVRGDEGFKPVKRGSPDSKWSEDESNFLVLFHFVWVV